jgi:FemAB-related protein (PEP-CTERM system-associated)
MSNEAEFESRVTQPPLSNELTLLIKVPMMPVLLDHNGSRPCFEQQLKNSFFHNQGWLDLITKLYGYSLLPLISLNADGQITGLLPLCSMKSPLLGRRLVALPFTDCYPLLATDEAAANELIDQAIRLAQEQKARYLELRTGVNEVLAKRQDLVEGNLYVNWFLPLAAGRDAVWSGLKKSVKRKVRKSKKLGVQVRLSQHRADMAEYYRLHLLTRSKKHGMPAQSGRFFFELWDSFFASGAMKLLLAEYQGTVIASEILFISGATVRSVYNASDKRYLHLAPNTLLLWEAISWSCSQGYQRLELGRTTQDNQGLMEFKRAWGSIKEPLPYYYYPAMAGLASTSESDWKYRLLTSWWKRLPLQVTGPLGGYLYKHLG